MVTREMEQLYQDSYLDKCEKLYFDVISTFDENTICNQAITTETPASIHFQIARILFSNKTDIGNEKYRGYIADKYFEQLIKTFIVGKMSFECYCYYKSWQCDFIKAIDYEAVALRVKQAHQQLQLINQNNNNSNDNKDNDNYNLSNNKIAIEFDITLLTRRRTADNIISPVIKNTSLYWSKLGWEHLKNSSQSYSIVGAFVHDVGRLSKADEYYEKLALEMIDIWPKYGLIRCNLGSHYYRASQRGRALNCFEQAVSDIPNNARILSHIMHFYTQSLKLGSQSLPHCPYNRKQRAERALECGKQLIELTLKGQYIRNTKYSLFAELLSCWSKDFETNKKEQKMALSIFEKAIVIDQNVGWDVINNWTREYNKFELNIKDIIIQYWYIANENNLRSRDILNYADLVETYFTNKSEKMKHAKVLSNSVPIESNVVVYVKYDVESDKKGMYYVSIRKPGKCLKKRILDYSGLNFGDYGVIIAWWYLDEGGGRGGGRYIWNNSENIEFCKPYAAKLAYFFTFMLDSNTALSKVGLTLDVAKKMRVLMIKLLIHYGWKLHQSSFVNIVNMVGHSNILAAMVDNFINDINNSIANQEQQGDDELAFDEDDDNEDDSSPVWTVYELGEICDKIEKMIDLNDQNCILKVADIVKPNIVYEKGDYER